MCLPACTHLLPCNHNLLVCLSGLHSRDLYLRLMSIGITSFTHLVCTTSLQSLWLSCCFRTLARLLLTPSSSSSISIALSGGVLSAQLSVAIVIVGHLVSVYSLSLGRCTLTTVLFRKCCLLLRLSLAHTWFPLTGLSRCTSLFLPPSWLLRLALCTTLSTMHCLHPTMHWCHYFAPTL